LLLKYERSNSTMKFGFSSLTIMVATAATAVEAVNHQVTVGLTGLTFSPNSVTAAAGDTIEFIVSGTHDIVEAAFGSPCSYLTGGAWSGLSPTPNFVITVSNTSPRFFYCSVATHCQSGMVFALNPSTTETESAFAAAAGSAGNSVTPSGPPVGGTSGPVPSSSGVSAGASSTSAGDSGYASSVLASSTVTGATTGSPSAAVTGSGTGTGVVAGSGAGRLGVVGVSVVCGVLLAMVAVGRG